MIQKYTEKESDGCSCGMAVRTSRRKLGTTNLNIKQEGEGGINLDDYFIKNKVMSDQLFQNLEIKNTRNFHTKLILIFSDIFNYYQIRLK